MKTLYIECNMGAAGDMLTAALVELAQNKNEIMDKLNGAGLPGVTFRLEGSTKCGIKGSRMRVLVDGCEEKSEDVSGVEHAHEHQHHDHSHHHGDENNDSDHHHGDEEHTHSHHHGEHAHSSMSEISTVADSLNVSDKVKDDVKKVYSIIAEAESRVHGAPVEKIHFHEVGAMDAVADVMAVSLLMEELKPDRVVVSPVNTGKGQVKCMHGIIPVPAPATALILQEVPCYSNHVYGELCTPTGAALLKHFADEFGSMPVMKVQGIGYGMGTKDFEEANCVRAFIGDEEKTAESVIELNFNVDDMTGEDIGFATEMLFESGAFEVFTTPVIMKKSRPGQLITVICSKEKKMEIVSSIFRHTSTIGIRETEHPRYVLRRTIENHESDYGSIRCKVSEGYGVVRRKYEYDDLADAARKNDVTIEYIRKSIKE